MADYGDLFRDSSESWVKGYARKIGVCDALIAEIWVMLHGLELAFYKFSSNEWF